MQELGQAVDQGRSATSWSGTQAASAASSPADGLGGRIEHRDHEVEDHEVVAVRRCARPSRRARRTRLRARSPRRARARRPRPAARPARPARRAPTTPPPRAVAPADQQQLLVLDDDGADAELGALHGHHGSESVDDDRPGDHAGRLEEVLGLPVARQHDRVDPEASAVGRPGEDGCRATAHRRRPRAHPARHRGPSDAPAVPRP